MKPLLAILDDYQGVALSCADFDSLRAHFDIRVYQRAFADEQETVAELGDAEVLVAMRERTRLSRSVLECLPKLRYIVTTGMRNAAIDMAAAAERGILVSGTGMSKHAAGELTWALVMAAARHIPAEVAGMRSGGWQSTVGTELNGRTLGIVGLGHIGTQVARYGQAFGMTVQAWSPNLDADRAAALNVAAVPKDKLFAESDVVSLHLVLSERTRGVVGAHDLALLGPTGLLVNTSRGPLVEEAALVEALSNGVLGAAALDVYDIEPLPASHPLRTLPNVVATPHIGFVTDKSYGVAYPQAVEDIQAWLAGAPIRLL
ncbi:D-2-hydroxyacid dehydrogenase family protein [Mycolicibacterium mengxianglii]|uniref:D-2-hydroxyacid dehydrogenase family protein n=1 Tax=Mycolicibacterium mengxianglii TaxID=2736649 RepID=UPI0018D112A6|nr:D-2-hydroxyacid dehydrogenase family protein [Mycolicibacterium mengxianglii]